MADKSSRIEDVEDVDIDGDGTFKYVLLEITDESANQTKHIVRGYSWAGYHADIYDSVGASIQRKGLGLEIECVGGGRIEHNPSKKKISVYGYSMGFGRADHKITVRILKEKYPDYKEITISNKEY